MYLNGRLTIREVLFACSLLLLLGIMSYSLYGIIQKQKPAGEWKTVNEEIQDVLETDKEITGKEADRELGKEVVEVGQEVAVAETTQETTQEATVEVDSAPIDQAVIAEPSIPSPVPGLIDLNKATSEQLQQLSGIGPSKAGAIIQYRESVAGFSSIEEIMKVKGIGPKTYEKLKDRISISTYP